MAQIVRNLPAVQETRVQFLDREDPLEKEMAIHSSTLAWKESDMTERLHFHFHSAIKLNKKGDKKP